jgi:hypothetical protein
MPQLLELQEKQVNLEWLWNLLVVRLLHQLLLLCLVLVCTQLLELQEKQVNLECPWSPLQTDEGRQPGRLLPVPLENRV